MSAAPWPIVRVEPRDGTWVRVWHRDGVVADHCFAYLLGGGGVFAALTPELIQTAQLVDGDTVGWVLADGSVIDLAPDALHTHAVTGRCPGGTCTGWTPGHTRFVDVEVAPESEWLAERRRRAEGRS